MAEVEVAAAGLGVAPGAAGVPKSAMLHSLAQLINFDPGMELNLRSCGIEIFVFVNFKFSNFGGGGEDANGIWSIRMYFFDAEFFFADFC